MGHSIGDAIIVAAIAGAILGYCHMKHVERRRRLEIVHQERLVAMEKGIPLPELPIDPPKVPTGPNPQATLVHGIVWTALGTGAMIALGINGPSREIEYAASSGSSWSFSSLWTFPLPMVFLGLGLMLYYFLATERAS